MIGAGTSANAQGMLDPSFTSPITKAVVSNGVYPVRTLLQQADGKILLGGSYDFVDNQRASRMRRLNADSSPDIAFAAQTGTGPESTGSVVALAQQSTGKILVGCASNRSYNGFLTGNLVRLNTTGSVDVTFNAGGTGFTYNPAYYSVSALSANNNVRSLAVQTDDKILVGGNIEFYNGQAAPNLLRLNPDGTLDTSFNVGSLGFTTMGNGANSGTPEVIVVQSDGKIVVGGSFSQVNGATANNIIRLNANGTPDNTFLNTGTNAAVRTIAIQPDGKLLVGGFFTQVNGQSSGSLVRLNADGTRDTSFGMGTLSPVAAATGIYKAHLLADGSVAVCGTFTAYNGTARGAIAKVSATGVLDTSFGPAAATTSTVSPNIVYEVLPIANGQLLAGGSFTAIGGVARSGLARLDSNAAQVDATYNPIIEFSSPVSQAIPLNNGDIIITGGYKSINGTVVMPGNGLIVQRLGSSGSYLGPTTLSTAPYSFTFSIPTPQPDGQFYVTGYNYTSTTYSGFTLIRLLASGNLDNSFTPVTFGYSSSSNHTDYAPQIKTLPNGDLLLTGTFNAVNGQPRPGLARVSAVGALDGAFSVAGAPWQTATQEQFHLVGVQPNGQPLVSWLDTGTDYLVRLSATTGVIDNTFSIGSGTNASARFYADMQPNGQVIISGNFASFNGQSFPNGILRLLPNGLPDPSFMVALPFSSIIIQPDGRLIGAARASSFYNAALLQLLRLNTDGSLDTAFPAVQIPQGIFLNTYAQLVLQPQDGKILVFGGITGVNGQLTNGLVRLTNTLLATRPAFAAAPVLDVFPNPAQQQVTLRLPTTAVSATVQPVTLLDMQGRTIRHFTLPARQTEATFSLADVAAGIYLLQASTSQGSARQRVAVTH